MAASLAILKATGAAPMFSPGVHFSVAKAHIRMAPRGGMAAHIMMDIQSALAARPLSPNLGIERSRLGTSPLEMPTAPLKSAS